MKYVWLLLKILLGLVVLLAIVITVLANIGGNSETLKNTIEGFFQDATGYEAEIGTLNNLAFFPNINVDFEDLQLREPGNENPSVLIDKLNVKIGFFDAVRSSGKIKNISIDNLRMKEGVITSKPLLISSITIADDPENPQRGLLSVQGKTGSQTIEASATLAAYGEGKGRTYDMGNERTIKARIGDITIKADMKNPSFTHIDLENMEVKQAGKLIVKGDLDVKSKNKSRVITGTLTTGLGSVIKPDVTAGTGFASGTVTAPKFHTDDIAIMGGMVAEITNLLPKNPQAKKTIDLQGQDVDLTIDLKKIIMGELDMGAQKIDLTVKDGTLKATAKDGSSFKGKTNWTAIVKPVKNAHNLSVTSRLDDLSIQEIMKSSINVDTDIDAVMTLNSTAKNWDGFAGAMNGSLTAVLNEGQFESGLLNLWSNGLGSLLLPNFDPKKNTKLNCGIVNSDIAKSIATFNTLFIDTPQMRLTGKGTYDLDRDALNLSLKPNTKGISIGDLSAGVKVTGPISKPRISADMVDVGKKAATALLGTINPAFFIASGVSVDSIKENVLGINDDEKEAAIDLCAAITAGKGDNSAQIIADHLKAQAVTQ